MQPAAKPIGVPLTERDAELLRERWIPSDLADLAGIRRVDSATGRDLMGAKDRGDYAGLIIPYHRPGETWIREFRLRRDRPEMEMTASGPKPRKKYISPPGRGNMLYFPPGTTTADLLDRTMPIVITEGEFKTLALWRLATLNACSARLLPIGVPGVWNWRGTIGKTGGPNGERLDVKGPIPDLDGIQWQGRKVAIAYDADFRGNDSVLIARASLAKELRRRGAQVGFLEWDLSQGKGIDDLLAKAGPNTVLDLWTGVKYRDSLGWRETLVKGRGGRPKAILYNAVLALREAPQWDGVLAFDEFSNTVVAKRNTPWSYSGLWGDHQTSHLAVWLQGQGIDVSTPVAHEAVALIARDNRFHPVQVYLENLEWDGTSRLADWVSRYLGVARSRYASLVGTRWMVSAVARILRPGCKADVALILEGPQGIGKSRAIRTLAGDWFTDQLPDLHSKDAAIQLGGSWIIELSELDALSRSETTTTKAFLSRQSDKFRPPYARITEDVPRQCVFAGTTNGDRWLTDETGARRYWPVSCGSIDVPGLGEIRDQLWAEAVALFRKDEIWWADSELSSLAAEETANRLEADPWLEPISKWVHNLSSPRNDAIGSGPGRVFISEVLQYAIDKPKGQWSKGDEKRVAACLRGLGFERKRVTAPEGGGRRPWAYVAELATLGPGQAHTSPVSTLG